MSELTENYFRGIMHHMAEAYCYKDLTDENVINTWYKYFKYADDTALLTAVVRHIRNREEKPTIASIEKLLVGLDDEYIHYMDGLKASEIAGIRSLDRTAALNKPLSRTKIPML